MGTSRIHNKMAAAGYTGIITIDIHACKDLHGMDTNFLSDPYVVIRVGDQKVQTSVQRRTVNPTWESGNPFELHASNDHLLLLEVWDKDTLTSDDAVAQLEIPLLDLMGNMNGWHELQRHPKFDIVNLAARAKHIAMDGVKTVTSQGSCGFGHYGDINMTITFEGSSGGFTSGSGSGGGGGGYSGGGANVGVHVSDHDSDDSMAESESYSYSETSEGGSKHHGRRRRHRERKRARRERKARRKAAKKARKKNKKGKGKGWGFGRGRGRGRGRGSGSGSGSS